MGEAGDDHKKNLLTSASQPDTVFEEDDELSDPDESNGLPIVVEEAEDLLKDSQTSDSRANLSTYGGSILEVDNGNEYNWALEDVVGLPIASEQRIVDIDLVDDRLFVIFDNLKLVEVNMQSKQIVKEFALAELGDASE